MSVQHPSLAAGRWKQFSLVEQMANVGSEVERTLNWRTKNNEPYSRKAFERSLELLDFTLQDEKNHGRLREIARAREALVDFFAGENLYHTTAESWHKYFLQFAYAARRNR